MLEHLMEDGGEGAIALSVLVARDYEGWVKSQPVEVQRWLTVSGFRGETGGVTLVPSADGEAAFALFIADECDPWCWAALPLKLPEGTYRLDTALTADQAGWAAIAWELAAYRFTRYKDRAIPDFPRLEWPANADRAKTLSTVCAIVLVRDLVNTPAQDMGPEELALAAFDLAKEKGALVRVITGDVLLHEGYPLIHAVGRASSRPPRLIDLRWGDETAPRVTLVGKGVCFDSGGLDIKGAANMKTMKKDMGGAAHALGVASLIMDAKLPIRLRVLIPAVDNAVSGSAFRPLDVLDSRRGLSVEIGNTDAEGRLILADCLTEACRDQPELLIDFATLTGAARVALGPDLPALLTPDDRLAEALTAAARKTNDPLWRLPLWKPYRRMLDSKIADISNASDSAFAGAITAGLFLQEFVTPGTVWAHLDIFAWNQAARPGRPEGGEAMGLRATYEMIASKYSP